MCEVVRGRMRKATGHGFECRATQLQTIAIYDSALVWLEWSLTRLKINFTICLLLTQHGG
jgi:hypothetical protein